jgi:hypothetical protein
MGLVPEFIKQDTQICFGNDGSVQTSSGQECKGLIDTPVVSSSECPFYKKNKNYLNEFGGKDMYGFCQMPEGISRVGFRFYDPNSTPVCHNCLIGNKKLKGNCCGDQENDPVTYTTLLSPDYSFESDNSFRKLRRAQLKTLDLVI